jgi:hypothetical protein
MTRVDARRSLIDAAVERDEAGRFALSLKLAIGSPGAVRPDLLLPVLCGEPMDARRARFHRTALRISGAGKEFSPLEVVESGFPWWRETIKRRAAGQRS